MFVTFINMFTRVARVSYQGVHAIV